MGEEDPPVDQNGARGIRKPPMRSASRADIERFRARLAEVAELRRAQALGSVPERGKFREQLATVFWIQEQDQVLEAERRAYDLADKRAHRCERQAAADGWLKLAWQATALVAAVVLLVLLSTGSVSVDDFLRLLVRRGP